MKPSRRSVALVLLPVLGAVGILSRDGGLFQNTEATATAAPTSSTPSCGGQQALVADGINWSCRFDSEFTGSSLDASQWLPITTATSGYTSGLVACFMNSPNNISVGNGYLSLTARKEAAPFTCQDPYGNFSTQYTSGMVSTYGLFSQAYGRFEVKAKLPAATVSGLQSSLWLYPNSLTYGEWPLSGEIDIAETYSQYPTVAVPYLHYNYDTSTADPATSINIVTNDACTIDPNVFNDYVVEWTPSTISMIYNGQTCLVDHWIPSSALTAPQPFDQPFFINLTQALGLATNNFDPATTPLPATSEIQYVRAWAIGATTPPTPTTAPPIPTTAPPTTTTLPPITIIPPPTTTTRPPTTSTVPPTSSTDPPTTISARPITDPTPPTKLPLVVCTTATQHTAGNPVAMAGAQSANGCPGYWVVNAGGGVSAFGNAPNYGGLNGSVASPVIDIIATPDGNGYWLSTANGTVRAFGDAGSFGDMSGHPLNRPIIAMAATPDGRGYWLVGSDGGIFTFGDAQFYGSTGAMALNQPVVGVAATPDGRGYWLVARDGGIFSFGDAPFLGSMGRAPLNQPVVGITADPAGRGYRMVAADGGIFSFGAPFFGSLGASPPITPVIAMAPSVDGNGYYLLSSGGGIYAFGDAPFLGSAS
jgi:beta-glucanase (GH16 family)